MHLPPSPRGRTRRRMTAVAATGVLAAVGLPAASASAEAADIRILGGNAHAEVVCGNVASALQFARQHGLAVQHNRCKAESTGGSVTLENVEIYVVSAHAREANRDNPILVALAGGNAGAARSTDNCDSYRTFSQRKQLNHCWSDGFGGNTVFDGVTQVYKDAAGRLARRTFDNVAVGNAASAGAAADCRNVVTDRLNQRDDCGSRGTGSGWRLTGVDARVRNSDGSTSLRKGITVEVRAGSATNAVYCFNSTDGSGRVLQLNVCNSRSRGGHVTLRNVTIHTYAG